ncbi:urease accessory protein UreE [Jannaschia sp. 2305UL9-9]|uniref:urease accessory protein UreE n=1 Tax=Jannaschia sp. 2305UL9-9 TaxID=3121638 RepID=UPI003528512A
MSEILEPPAVILLDHLHHAADSIRLDYDARLVRRKRLITDGGRAVMLDLAELTDLSHFAGLRLSDGTEIALEAAAEPVLVVEGNLPRLAWHIGNRHTPCQIEDDHLIIRDDHVLRGMLEGLGAKVTPDTRPFRPEGGAYGHGRTMGHDHGHDH